MSKIDPTDRGYGTPKIAAERVIASQIGIKLDNSTTSEVFHMDTVQANFDPNIGVDEEGRQKTPLKSDTDESL